MQKSEIYFCTTSPFVDYPRNIFPHLCIFMFTFYFYLYPFLHPLLIAKEDILFWTLFHPLLLIARKGILSLKKKTWRVKTRNEFCKIAFDGAKGDRGNNFCNQAKVKGTISSSPGLGTNFNFWLVWRNFTSDVAILKDIWLRVENSIQVFLSTKQMLATSFDSTFQKNFCKMNTSGKKNEHSSEKNSRNLDYNFSFQCFICLCWSFTSYNTIPWPPAKLT